MLPLNDPIRKKNHINSSYRELNILFGHAVETNSLPSLASLGRGKCLVVFPRAGDPLDNVLLSVYSVGCVLSLFFRLPASVYVCSRMFWVTGRIATPEVFLHWRLPHLLPITSCS